MRRERTLVVHNQTLCRSPPTIITPEMEGGRKIKMGTAGSERETRERKSNRLRRRHSRRHVYGFCQLRARGAKNKEAKQGRNIRWRKLAAYCRATHFTRVLREHSNHHKGHPHASRSKLLKKRRKSEATTTTPRSPAGTTICAGDHRWWWGYQSTHIRTDTHRNGTGAARPAGATERVAADTKITNPPEEKTHSHTSRRRVGQRENNTC